MLRKHECDLLIHIHIVINKNIFTDYNVCKTKHRKRKQNIFVIICHEIKKFPLISKMSFLY